MMKQGSGRRLLWALIKLLLFLAVVAGIAVFVRGAWSELGDESAALAEVNGLWLLAALVSYTLGMLPFWIFWHHVLRVLNQSPTWRESARAYFIGHLGKYVPGKAMVVLMRATLIRSERTDATVAGAAVFVETLTMMSVGACLAAICLMVRMPHHPGWVFLSLLMMALAGLPTAPPIFRRLIRLLQVRRLHQPIEGVVSRLGWSTFFSGWGLGLLGWIGIGVSLYLVICAMTGGWRPVGDVPGLVGAAALSVVAGFLSLIPAGAGVRELVLLPLLSEYGDAKAVLSVVIVRLVWLVSELGLSIILYLWAPRRAPPNR